MGKLLCVLSRQFDDLEKVSERAKRFPDKQRHNSIHNRQTVAKWISEEAGQGANGGEPPLGK
jgi:hypothetical protein